MGKRCPHVPTCLLPAGVDMQRNFQDASGIADRDGSEMQAARDCTPISAGSVGLADATAAFQQGAAHG